MGKPRPARGRSPRSLPRARGGAPSALELAENRNRLPIPWVPLPIVGSLSGFGVASPDMRWDIPTIRAICGLAALLVSGALLLVDAPGLFLPVTGMVAGIAVVARASHEQLKLRIDALEQGMAQAEWRDGVNRDDAA